MAAFGATPAASGHPGKLPSMNKPHTRTATTILLLAALALTIWALATPGPAHAHTVRTADCYAAAKASGYPYGSYYWKATLNRCMRYAKRHNLAHTCAKPRPLIARATVKGQPADRAQRANLTRILNLGRKVGARYVTQVAIVAAATQESSARNIPYGHGTSVGILQLIDIHGSVAWRMVIENSAGWFFRGAAPIARANPSIAPGRLAQAVQRSAYPDAYHQWVPEARRTVRAFYGPCRT